MHIKPLAVHGCACIDMLAVYAHASPDMASYDIYISAGNASESTVRQRPKNDFFLFLLRHNRWRSKWLTERNVRASYAESRI